MKKIFKTAIFLLLSLAFFNPTIATAKIDIGSSTLLEDTGQEAGYDAQQTDETSFAENIGQVVQFAMSFLAVIFTVLMVYGGFLWMTARGDSDQVDRAQKIITQAVVGLIIAAASYSISAYVVSSVL